MSKKKTPAVRIDAIARQVMAHLRVVPEYPPEEIDVDAHDALIKAVESEMNEDALEKWATAEIREREDAQVDAIIKRAKPQVRALFLRVMDRCDTNAYLREQVAYVIGVEVGRRIGGAR